MDIFYLFEGNEEEEEEWAIVVWNLTTNINSP
jgi:hypothetical protein